MLPAAAVAIDLTLDDGPELGVVEAVDVSNRSPDSERNDSPIVVDLTDDCEIKAVDVESSSSGDEGPSLRKRARYCEPESSGGVPDASLADISSSSASTSQSSSLDTNSGGRSCSWCKKEPGCEVVQLVCNHFACKSCLVAESDQKGRCHVCKRNLDVSDLQGLLPADRMTAFLDKLLYSMVEDDARFVRCPNDKCGNVIERAEEGSGELPKHAPDGQPLSRRHAAHMQSNRYRCNACGENFCASCKQLPYHLAQTCEEAAASRAAVHCRFCSAQLPKGSKEGSACDSEDCQKRKDQVCDVVHRRCGHRCLGCFGEAACMPCLECKGTAGDFCNICWTEELRAAPCLQLECGHAFHLHCLRERLEKRWPTAKISFSFARCPLCNTWVKHSELDGALRQVHALRHKVEAAALERLTLENPEPAPGAGGAAGGAESSERRRGSKGKGKRAHEPAQRGAGAAVIDVDGEGAREGGEGEEAEARAEAAMKRYNFYQCVKCSRPYFGGAAACGAVEQGEAEAGAEGRQELMCGACSAAASGYKGEVSCRRHGEKYVEFKCRFCCEVATFFCFGHTHFCEACHRKWTQGAHKSPASLVKRCSCGQRHSPNSTTQAGEFCYGCSLCRIKKRDNAPI